MDVGNLEKNIAATVKDMKAQTGKEAGGPTGLCHFVVTGALTGAALDFTVDVTRENQIKIESQNGLANYPIVVEPRVLISTAVPAILEQTQVPFEALLLTGKVNNTEEMHIIAVVPDRTEKEFVIIDSLVPDAKQKTSTSQGVVDFVNTRFDTVSRALSYSVVLTKEEQQRRISTKRNQPVPVGAGIFI